MTPKACAARTVLGKRKKKIRGSGTYEVCLTPTQRRKLFGSAPIDPAIGCGTFACVFPKDSKTVVKLTKDREDVDGLQAAKGLRRVVKVRSVKELKNAGYDPHTRRPVHVYAVTAERLEPLSSSMQRWLDRPLDAARRELLSRAEHHRSAASTFDLNREERATIAQKACSRAPSKPKCELFIGEFAEAFAQLFRRGVVFQDSHPGNFGVDKKGRWKILDLGYSGIKKRAIVPVLAAPASRRR